MKPLSDLARDLLPVLERAGGAIMQIYDDEFAVKRKADNSPVTLADLESQRVIIQALHQLTPDIPVLSEESAHAPWLERRDWRNLWIVDPLDGTREFIKRNGEFTVNIALIVDNQAVLGCIGAPARHTLYWGSRETGAFVRHGTEAAQPIRISAPHQPLRVAGSRSHLSAQTAAYLARMRPHTLLAVGSSLKFCLIAQGDADLYARFGPTSEWDTAAGQAILEAAGGHVTRIDGHPLRYNCRETLLNGDFVAFNDAEILPP